MKLKLIVPPVSMPVSLSQAKSFYRITSSNEDTDIQRTITAAVEKAEQITNRQLSRAAYEGYMDSFPVSVEIPRPPLYTVMKVEYIDIDGVKVLWADYTVDDVSEPAVLYFNSTPEDVRTDSVNNIIITFETGYAECPEAIRSWILIYGLTLFEHRENINIAVSVDSSNKAYYDRLLNSYRLIPV